MLAGHGKAADVVQGPAVVRLPHEGVHRADVGVAVLGQGEGHHGLKRRPHGERVRQDDRRLDRPQLLDLRPSRELAERIADEHGARDLVLEQVAAVGQDCRHPGADAVAFHECLVPDAHARDVGDRVQRTRREHAGRDAEVTGARAERSGHGRGDEQQQSESSHGPPSSRRAIVRTLGVPGPGSQRRAAHLRLEGRRLTHAGPPGSNTRIALARPCAEQPDHLRRTSQ